MPPKAEHPAAQIIQDLAQPVSSLNPAQRLEGDIVCEAAKRALRDGVRELIQAANGFPILTSKSCDCTPMSLMHFTSRKLPSGQPQRMAGRMGTEWLVQNQFFRCFTPAGECLSRVQLTDPICLTYGKTVPAILSASFKDWCRLRDRNHWGISIEHYVVDRAGFTAMDRLIRQWHEGTPMRHCPPSMTTARARTTELVVITPCALHDSQNAFKWGFFKECSDQNMMRDTYVAVESLRNSADLLSQHMAAWVRARLRLVPPRSAEWMDRQSQLWHSMSVHLETVDVMACQLQLEWAGGELLVSQAAEVDGDLVEVICSALAAAWRFVKFTTSRWLTVGHSARTVVVALLLGIEDFVKYIAKDTHSSLFYLKGFGRLAADRRRFMVQCAVASRVAEGVQTELMEDSRVALNYRKLWLTLAEEVRWLVDLDMFIWDKLATLCGGMSGRALANRCIQAGHISMHFFWRRVLHPCSQYPWRLLRGDIEGNLRAMHEAAPPADPVSAKLWELVEQGLPMPQLVMAVKLLGEIPWSSMPAEQQHGSLAAFRRWHPGYGMETIGTRAMLHQMSRLLPAVSEDQKMIAKINGRIRKLEAACPERVGGRHIFLKGLVVCALVSKKGGDPRLARQTPGAISKALFVKHAALWARQSVRMQDDHNKQARLRAAERRDAISAELSSLESQLELIGEQHQAGEAGQGPLTMSSCALPSHLLDAIQRMVANAEFRRTSAIQGMRKEAFRCPFPWAGADFKERCKIPVLAVGGACSARVGKANHQGQGLLLREFAVDPSAARTSEQLEALVLQSAASLHCSLPHAPFSQPRWRQPDRQRSSH